MSIYQTSEFQGILTLNANLVDQLYRYLEGREERACQTILKIVEIRQSEPASPSYLPPLKLTETVDLVGKKIRGATQNRQNLTAPADWRPIADKISKALWSYLEILEGCVTELFQQLDQVGVEEWRIELAHIVDAIKEMLLHRLDDLSWTIRRLEHQLYDYRAATETRDSKWALLKKAGFFWQSLLDSALMPNLEKCRKYLGFRYQKFSDQYERYIDIHTAIELVVDKFSEYQVFHALESDTQDKFKKLYRLVRLWQLNQEERALPRRETIRALRNAISPERALSLFREYDHQLWRAIYEISRRIKEKPWELSERGNINRIQEQIAGYRVELNTLSSTLGAYRDFLLKSDPGMRAKGPESHETRQLAILSDDLKSMDEMMIAFGKSLDGKGVTPELSSIDVDQDVQSVLHEMAQPLISRQTMQARGEHFISLIQSLNLLSNSDKRTVDYVGHVLNKAMRADWQYQVLFERPAFHQLYATYRGLVGPLDERGHMNRMQKFKRLIQQLEQWVSNHATPRHTHEIEVDLSDMKGYLQDFLAYAQRISKEENPDSFHNYAEVAQQLLEYRYLFGNFFHRLQDDSTESRMLRKQLLFVDQYFEAVETRLPTNG